MTEPLTKSKGHVCFWSDIEVVEINESLWSTKISNAFDPDGYRYGLTGLLGETRESWLRNCQRFIDSAADGEYYDMHVRPENEDLFRRPSPDPDFLQFYKFCKENFSLHPEIKEDTVRIWSLSTRLDRIQKSLRKIATVSTHFNGEYSELKFPLDRLLEVHKLLETEQLCGR